MLMRKNAKGLPLITCFAHSARHQHSLAKPRIVYVIDFPRSGRRKITDVQVAEDFQQNKNLANIKLLAINSVTATSKRLFNLKKAAWKLACLWITEVLHVLVRCAQLKELLLLAQSVRENRRTSTRHRAQQLDVSRTSLRRILHKDLGLFAY
ncbi:hypothetical protein NQ318_018441, partial [Aromia moschata]